MVMQPARISKVNFNMGGSLQRLPPFLYPMLMMKLTTLILLAACLTSTAFADTDTANGTGNSSGVKVGRGRHGGSKKGNQNATSKNPNVVRGSCAVIASPSNPFPGPCVNITLVINDSEGKEILKTRTSTKGEIEFMIDPSKPYRVISGSRFYNVAAPKELVKGSHRLDVKLQQK